MLASRLDEPRNMRRGDWTDMDEEDEKLLFVWDECRPSDAGSGRVWEKTLQKIRQAENHKSVERKRRLWPVWSAAASVAILIGVTFFYLGRENAGVDERVKMEQILLAHTDTDEVQEVTLVVSEEEKIELANNSKVTYNVAGQVSVNSTKLAETGGNKKGTEEPASGNEPEYNQLIVPKGRRSMVILADNSRMWVNSGTKVIYPRSFKGDRREIFVEGEVYLQVTHDETKPFIVNTSTLDVEVLGTSFNVSAYKGDAHASVVLVEGSVDVKDVADRHVRMQPNERVQLDDAGVMQKEVVNASDYIHWVDGIWVLNGKPLKEVLAYLSEYYGKPLACDPAIENELFYGKLFLNEELDKVLESIRQTLPEEMASLLHGVEK